MDASSVPVLLYRRSKPLGKVRRRVQDLRIPSSSCYGFAASRPALDLSHNESARLAADSLLSRGLEGYHEVLNAEGEVDFLSELEKNYFLENGSDGNTDDPGASHDGERELENVYGPQSATASPAVSTDSDSTVSGLDLGSLKDMKQADPVLDEPNVEVYFQADSRAAGMKDLIRKFIRKAGMALAIVMDSFSDVELLCDLLEASRKRNVSVHLLLDHFNLNLFLGMWQDLKLDSKSFPKLSVHSVDGQTYCAKTGRKLTGQIAENFIITDWTEVLTGSYSFSWLTWRVHRSLAVLVTGSTVKQFHREFLRLHSSSKPVPGFVNFITVPHTLPLHTIVDASQNAEIDASKSKLSPTKTTSHSAGKEEAQNTQAKAKMSVLLNPETYPDKQTLHRAGAGTQMQEKPPQLYLKPLVQPEAQQIASQIQSRSNPLSQTPVAYVQSQLTSLTITTIAENNVRAQEPITVHTASPTHKQHRITSYQSTFKGNLQHHDVDTEGLLFRQRNRTRPMEPSGTAAGRDTQSRHRNYSLKIEPKFLPPSMSQQKQAKTGLRFPLTPQKGHTSGLQTQVSSLGTRRQDQPALPAHATTEAPGSKSASSAMGAHLQPQLQTDSKLFSPGALHLQPHASHQARPPPGLNWMPQSRAERPRPVTRHSSFDATYGTGQKTDGQEGWRPLQSGMDTLLGRSKSMNPNQTKS